MTRYRPHLLVLALLATVVLAPGCSSTRFDAVAGNLTPSLRGMVTRPIDIDADLAMMVDTNDRGFANDLGRAFYTDHPSRLQPYPVVSSSGEPR